MNQTTTYHFNKENVKPHDIFYAEHYDFNGVKVGHYFYCVHAQYQDKHYELFRDIIGLMITTKDAVGYAYPVTINGKPGFVCCDREIRFISEIGKVNNKFIDLPLKDKKGIINLYKKYGKEKLRQLKKELTLK